MYLTSLQGIYITANALSVIIFAIKLLRKFSKIFKSEFFSYNTLLAENFVAKEIMKEQKIYLVIKRSGETGGILQTSCAT